MTDLLDACGLTVELPTPAGWMRPVNDVSLRIAAGESLGLVVNRIAENDAGAGIDGITADGRVVEEGPTPEVLRTPRHPYTQGLLVASPSLERGKLMQIPGSIPQLTAIPRLRV